MEEGRGGGGGSSCHAHLTEAEVMRTTEAEKSDVLVKVLVSSGNKWYGSGQSGKSSVS